MDILTYALAKKYVDKTIEGSGALKGKNCIITDISPITGGNRVTFQWTLDDGTIETDTMDVMDGENGLGIKSVDINAQNHLIVTYDDDTTEDAGELPDGYPVKVYEVMPSNADLIAMPNGTIFQTLGFYTKNDGNGGLYRLSGDWKRGTLILQTSPRKVLEALNDDGSSCTNDLYVCRYGVRSMPDQEISDWNNLSPSTTYATTNSDIIESLYGPAGYSGTLIFPVGRFFFERPISLISTQSSIRGTKSVWRTTGVNKSGYSAGTTLYFPFLTTNNQSAIQLNFGDIEDITVVGSYATYNFSIDRTKTISAPNEVVTETIKQVDNNEIHITGIYKSTSGRIRNVFVTGFYTGCYCETANTYIEQFNAQRCHYGLSIGGDIKCIGIYGWNVDTLIVFRNSISSATSVRVDNCVNAVKIWSNGITITDLDGDYCTESLVSVGQANSGVTISKCVLTGIHGRCCTLKSYDSTQSSGIDVRDLVDTDGYGIINIKQGTTFTDSIITLNSIGGSNPFDSSSNYVTPKIVLTFKVGAIKLPYARNQFIFSDAVVTDEVSVKKYFQMRADDNLTSKVTTQDNIYLIKGTDVTVQSGGDEPIIITYEQWQQLTPEQQESGIYIVQDYPSQAGANEIWYPTVSASGDISWSKSATTTPPETQNIKGPAGADGADGADGAPGADGEDGLGIKSVDINASNHLIVTYDDDTTYDAGEIQGGSASWGSITGTLADQTDLKNALDNKVNSDYILVDAGNLFDRSTGIETGYYINLNGGKATDSKYNIYHVYGIEPKKLYTFSGYNYSYAFYNSNGVKIIVTASSSSWHSNVSVLAPDNAAELRISIDNRTDRSDFMVVQGATLPETFIPYGSKKISTSMLDIADIEQSFSNNVISCWGDSVTEGMSMTDAHQAIYDGDTYPSQLLTMIINSGYKIKVNNFGHGGEKTQAIIARMGLGVYLSEDITIDASNTPVDISAKLLSPYDDATVVFTQLSHDTNPVVVDGVTCTLTCTKVNDSYTMTIKKAVNDNVATIIRAGSLFTTAGKRNARINIVYMGCNDDNTVTMSMFTERCEAVLKNYTKCLIIGGSSSTFWTKRGVTREQYLAIMRKSFGAKFLDLYEYMTDERGINIAISGGYLSDRTAEQIAADETAIANHQTPPSLTVDGTAGNVHFNAAGYYVFAKLVYDRIRELGYIL